MINLFNNIEHINSICLSLCENSQINDYRIILNYNNEIDVYIILGKSTVEEIEMLFDGIDNVNLNYYTIQEYESPDFMEAFIFESNEKVNVTSTRRRLSNLLDPIKPIKNEIPIVTFYSYKGGVGRSTTLASCASYLAINNKKKVVILDCDFEAPGFTNFYLTDPCSPIYSDGLVEYFIDDNEKEDSLSGYYYEISKQYTGDGEIYVFPAGNLDDKEKTGSLFHTNLNHYINGLTRLDFYSPDVLVNQFRKLIKRIKDQINPDVIFIDSRTGFNDIFGISAFRLSDLVVGFFGNSTQTIPGFHFYLDALKNENSPRMIVVNSIVPAQGKRAKFESFNKNVDNYLSHLSSDLENEDGAKELSVERYCITYNEVLAALGTPDEDYRDFVDMITEHNFPEYNTLFDSVNNIIDDSKHLNSISKDPQIRNL